MRIRVLLFAVLLLTIGTVGFFGYRWFIQKQIKTLNETGIPQIVNENVQTVQTPEQTHQKFMEALRANNLNAAVECCFRKDDWDAQKKFIAGVADRGQLNLMISDLEKISPDVVGASKATYVYAGTSNGQKVANFMTFVKNSQGVWLIESF